MIIIKLVVEILKIIVLMITWIPICGMVALEAVIDVTSWIYTQLDKVSKDV